MRASGLGAETVAEAVAVDVAGLVGAAIESGDVGLRVPEPLGMVRVVEVQAPVTVASARLPAVARSAACYSCH